MIKFNLFLINKMGIVCSNEKIKKNKTNIELKLENNILPKILNNLEYKLKIIKSNYILKKIFNNLEKKILFYIIKYNKNIKKRLDIDIDDYKKYPEKYSSIEIEIKLVNNSFGKFINIKNEINLLSYIF